MGIALGQKGVVEACEISTIYLIWSGEIRKLKTWIRNGKMYTIKNLEISLF